MTVKRSKRRCFLTLTFIVKSVSESESSILDYKGIDSTVKNHKSCEFWNPDYFTMGDHHIILWPYFSIARS